LSDRGNRNERWNPAKPDDVTPHSRTFKYSGSECGSINVRVSYTLPKGK
jgi:hypothetical protein